MQLCCATWQTGVRVRQDNLRGLAQSMEGDLQLSGGLELEGVIPAGQIDQESLAQGDGFQMQ